MPGLRPIRPAAVSLAFMLLVAPWAMACEEAAPEGWAGRVDTLASGQVVVSNPATPLWPAGGGWSLVEELRIGTMDGDGPELFGQVGGLAVDDAGRIYVLDAQAQEVRVFDGTGSYVRTIGRTGGGPGEFARALQLEFGPDGRLWVADPQNNRVSVFDTTGSFVDSHPAPGGFVLIPWPGRFDRHGRYHYPVPRFDQGEFRIGLARYDAAFQPLDTLAVPTDPVERDFFELRRGESVSRASVPFAGSFRWRVSPEGTFWGMLTGEYRLFELSAEGDTLRTITRAFDPVPVTDADRAEAREDLEWFLEEGGQVDWSLLPATKPAVENFTFDDAGNLWTWPVTSDGARSGRELDVFDPDGRYLGRVTSPVPIRTRPYPVFRDGAMYAVTVSDLEVPFVVRLRLDPAGAAGPGR